MTNTSTTAATVPAGAVVEVRFSGMTFSREIENGDLRSAMNSLIEFHSGLVDTLRADVNGLRVDYCWVTRTARPNSVDATAMTVNVRVGHRLINPLALLDN